MANQNSFVQIIEFKNKRNAVEFQKMLANPFQKVSKPTDVGPPIVRTMGS